MGNQKTGNKIRTERINEPRTRVPGLIARLGNMSNPRISNPEKPLENMKTEPLFTKVNVRPNPFFTSITLEITCEQNKQVVVRMANEDGRIIKLFGWYLLKGTNVTTITELSSLHKEEYSVDVLDNDGSPVFNVRLNKA